MTTQWLEPDYYSSFSCKCGECRNTCCSSWNIAISMEEYHRLIGLDCSEQLHRKIQSAFTVPRFPTPEHNRDMSHNWLGNCYFLSEEGLCSLQIECGEEAIPAVCRLFPRQFEKEGDNRRLTCSAGCEAVVEKLIRKEALKFSVVFDDRQENVTDPSTQELLNTREEIVNLLSDRSQSLQKRIQNIIEYMKGVSPKKAEENDALGKVADVLPVFSDISASLKDYADYAYDRYADEGNSSYIEDSKAFVRAFPDWEDYFENLLINHVYYADVPNADHRIKCEDDAFGLSLLYAMMRVLCAAWCAGHGEDEMNLTDVVTAIFRMAEHSSFYYNSACLIKNTADAVLLTSL